MAEEFDIGPLTWVKDEIDQALKSVLENLDAFASNPADTSVLKFSETHLFQVSGALDMVGLQGCKRICSELEKVVSKLEKGTLTSSPEVINVLKQSIQLLDHYLYSLLNGAPDLPLTLYPAVKSIADLHGESVTESELFFPDTSIRAPKSLPSEDVAEDQLSSLVSKQRAAFQVALVKWLKTSSRESLETMREALDNVQKAQKQAAQRTLWWLASVFTDVLAQKTIAEQSPVKLLCRQLDQQLRSLSLGNTKATGNLVRDLLFFIAQSQPLTERISQVKSLFELDALLPQGSVNNALAPVEINEEDIAVFKILEEIVTNLKDSWSAIAEGGGKDLSEFTAYLDQAVIETQKLGESDLTHLLETLHGVMAAMQEEPEKYNEETFVEVAASLNLMQDVLANQEVFAAKAMSEMQTQNQRLQALLGGDVTVETLSVMLDEGTLLAMAQQIREALVVVEQSLDTFFRNPLDRTPLSDVSKPLQQVIAAFDMLDMSTATKIAESSSKLVTYFNENPNLALKDAQSQFELVAESLSMLGFFVDDFPRIRPESLKALEAALSRLDAIKPAEDTAQEALVEAVADTTEPPLIAEKVSPKKASVVKKIDPELLDIFVTEAEEVLASVAQHLQALRVNNTDHDALKEVRRGYHTLKGSGRTVGLDALGEIAWAVEKLLNVIIDSDVLPSANQLTFIEKTSAAFSGWVAELQETGTSEPSFVEWQAEAQILESETSKQKPAAEAAEVLIGGTRKISRTLFNIFLAEAKRHVESMKVEYSAFESNPQSSVSSTLLRAAHTLASNAGSTGFKHLSDLSRALENWLEVYSGVWEAKSLMLLANVIQSLEDMLVKVEALDEPKRASALLTALRKATESASPPEVPVEATSESLQEQPLTLDDLSLPASLAVQPETEESAAQPSNVLPDIALEAPQLEVADAIQVSSPLDQELLSIFTEEARELVPQIGNELRAWRKNPAESDHPDALQRALHTLKGSARMAGQSEMGNVVHAMEDRIIQALKRKVTAVDFDDMFQDIDTIGALLEDLTGDSKVGRKAAPKEGAVGRAGNRRAQFLRLRADVLDRLINEAGEVSIARSRMEREMQAFKHFSLDLTESVFRLRNYLRELEIETESQMQSRMTLLQEAQEAFDPLEFDRFTRLQELTRMMAESVNDVSTIQNGLLLNLNETESALQQQNRMNRELQYGLMDVRMVPFSVISERMHRIVRQTAHELNKSVELSIEGESVDIDRSVLDKIGAPLEHLLRNSVGHGIEKTAERIKKRKPEIAQIQLKVKRENDEIIITVADDGAGIKLDKVREKAIKNGLIQPDQETTDQSLLAVIFEPGFSTATDITQISGRGVGLDAVRGDITGLGGRIEVLNSPDKGASFTISLPVTLSVAQVVLVRSAHHLYALPSIMVEQLQKLKPVPLAAAYEAKAINWADREYPIHYFGKLIGETDIEPEQQAYTPILLLRSGTNRIALHVDEIIGNQEVVMKPIGFQLARVPGITGATVMGDGNIVLIVNPVQMANREVIIVSHAKVVAAERDADIKPTVMVVDDSLTMRKVLSRTLEREGYAVVAAKDGMDGLQVLQETKPDLILLDIEMPRMDGFEFARNVRGDPVTAGIPIIMISSRTAEKHQSHAKELGVNAFLGKPVQDDDLLTEINVQLGKSAVSA